MTAHKVCVLGGTGFIGREVVARLPEGPSDLAAVQSWLARSGALRALACAERFYEIGSEAGYRELEALFGAASEGSG